MAKRSTIVSLVAVALLLAGTAVAIVKLYSDTPSRDNDYSASLSDDWTLLRAVPSDAAAVLVLDGSSAASRILADSSGILKGILAPKNPELMAFLQAIGRKEMAVSLHNSGSLVPLVVARVEQEDTLARKMASQAGLRTLWKEGFLMASRSETFVGAAARHLEEGHTLLGTRRLQDLVGHLSGHAILLLSHAHADKLLQVYAGKPYQKASFVKGLTAWSGWELQEEKDRILLKGRALEGEGWESYFAAFKGASASRRWYRIIRQRPCPSPSEIPRPIWLRAARKRTGKAGWACSARNLKPRPGGRSVRRSGSAACRRVNW